VLQILLALHTVVGALWKLSNSEQSVPSLSAIPSGIWRGLSAVEVLLGLGLVLPAVAASLAVLAPLAALGVVAEMLFFGIVHVRSGTSNHGQLAYWLVVAVISAFIAYARFVLAPI
jgi:hypothetical protein